MAFAARVFDLAYFWKVSPREIMALSLIEFDEWESQAVRLAEILRGEGDG